MPNQIQNARNLRKNMTISERKLWHRLRNHQMFGEQFRRQAPIGTYIVDFVCFSKKLIIELDGSQHKAQQLYDEKRTAWLSSQGFKVVRFWNNEVIDNIDAVVQRIGELVEGYHPHPNPPHQGGGNKTFSSREKRPPNPIHF